MLAGTQGEKIVPPPCKVCHSSNRAEYERLRAEGKPFRELSRVAKGFNEDIHFTAFARHFHKDHKTTEQKPAFVPANKETWGWADTSGGSSEGSMRDFNDLK